MLNASNFEFFAQGLPSFINLSARYSSLRQCMSATPSLMSLYVLDREKQEFVPSMIQVTIASGISELNDERSKKQSDAGISSVLQGGGIP